MKITSRKLKEKLYHLLELSDSEAALVKIENFPLKSCIGPLFSFFHHKDENIRWRSIAATGLVTARMAETDMEAARVVMRRLMWNLNDESGGIGWGCPEAMGEIMARHQSLADEYHNILMSYMCEDGNYLEFEMLQRGVLWGFGRLAHARPQLLYNHSPLLVPFILSSDPNLKGLAAWAAGPLDRLPVEAVLQGLLENHSVIRIFLDLKLVDKKVSQLARETLEYPKDS